MNSSSQLLVRHKLSDGFSGYSVKFSPFYENRISASTAKNFGLVGNGKLVILDLNADNRARTLNEFLTQDALFDLAFSEINENQLATGSGDGSIKLWDVNLKQYPIKSYKEHGREVFSLDWNCNNKKLFLSSSWDKTIKLWSPEHNSSLLTFYGHTACVYCAVFSPASANIVGSVSEDCTLKIWDTSQKRSMLSIKAHEMEILSMDFNKYKSYELVTASVDKSIKIWDLRNLAKDVMSISNAHQLAIRKIRYSNYYANVFGTCSYDTQAKIWDSSSHSETPVKYIHNHHTEFICGIDFSLFRPDLVATCAWDSQVHITKI